MREKRIIMSDLGIYVMFIFGVMLAFEALEKYKNIQSQKYDIEEKKLASVQPSEDRRDLKTQMQAMHASLPKIQRPMIIRFDSESMRAFDTLKEQYPMQEDALLGVLVKIGLRASKQLVKENSDESL